MTTSHTDLDRIKSIVESALKENSSSDGLPSLDELIGFVGKFYELPIEEFEVMRHDALANPESSRKSFLELWKNNQPVEHSVTAEKQIDDRKTCRHCARLEQNLQCNAARKGELAGASERYHPDVSTERECTSFKRVRDPMEISNSVTETPILSFDPYELGCHQHDLEWIKKMLSENFSAKKIEMMEEYKKIFREEFKANDNSILPKHRRDGLSRKKANNWLLSLINNKN